MRKEEKKEEKKSPQIGRRLRIKVPPLVLGSKSATDCFRDREKDKEKEKEKEKEKDRDRDDDISCMYPGREGTRVKENNRISFIFRVRDTI